MLCQACLHCIRKIQIKKNIFKTINNILSYIFAFACNLCYNQHDKKGLIMFEKAKTRVKTLQGMKKLHEDLSKLGEIPQGKDIYDYAIKFFNIITKFQDNFTVNQDMFPKTSKSAGTLAKHIENAGRQQYGWVRSKRGEEVTMDNLYLGDTHGIWTNTASKFYNEKNEEVQKIIQSQLKNFISSHRKPMLELLKELTINNKPNPLMEKIFSNNKQK